MGKALAVGDRVTLAPGTHSNKFQRVFVHSVAGVTGDRVFAYNAARRPTLAPVIGVAYVDEEGTRWVRGHDTEEALAFEARVRLENCA